MRSALRAAPPAPPPLAPAPLRVSGVGLCPASGSDVVCAVQRAAAAATKAAEERLLSDEREKQARAAGIAALRHCRCQLTARCGCAGKAGG